MRKTPRLDGKMILLCSVAVTLSCAHPAAPPKNAPAAARLAAPVAPALAPLTLIPADVARASLVATIVAPTVDRAIDSGIALARLAAPLPLDAAAVRDMALGEVGISPEVGRQLDLGSPVSGAVVGGGHGEMLSAFSFAVKAGVDPAALLSSVGHVTARRGAALQVETPSNGRGWFLPVGNAVVFAESELALVQAGGLALEARRVVKDDLSVVVYPDTLARAAGTDMKSAIERALGQIDELAAAGGSKLGPEGRLQLREIVNYAADVGSAEFAVKLDAARGVALLVRLRAKPASKLESVAKIVATVPISPLLFGKGDSGLVVTSAYAGRMLEQLRRQGARLPATGGKDVTAAHRLLDAVSDGLVGTLSMVGRLKPGLAMELVYPIKDASSAANLQAALLGTDRAAFAAIMSAATQGEAVSMKVTKVRQESAGPVRASHSTMTFTLPGEGAKGILKKLIGASGLDVYAAVVGGDRLVMTMGPGAKARLAAMAVAAKKQAGAVPPALAVPPGALAEATAESAGRSLFYFVDLREGLAAALALANGTPDPRLRLLSGVLRAPMPVLGGVTGDPDGRVLTLDVTVPASCIAGIGGLMGAIIGGGISSGIGTSSMTP